MKGSEPPVNPTPEEKKAYEQKQAYYNTVAPPGVDWCLKDLTGSCSYSFIASDEVCYEAKTEARPDYLDMVYKHNLAHPFLGKTVYASTSNYRTWFPLSCAARGFAYDKKVHPCFKHAYSAFKDHDAQIQ